MVNSMPYVEACIREIMRHETTVPLSVPHRAMIDTNLGGYNIPEVRNNPLVNLRSFINASTDFPMINISCVCGVCQDPSFRKAWKYHNAKIYIKALLMLTVPRNDKKQTFN